jgi:hypothetical protein
MSSWIEVLFNKANACLGVRLLSDMRSTTCSLISSEDGSDARVQWCVVLLSLCLGEMMSLVCPGVNVPLL